MTHEGYMRLAIEAARSVPSHPFGTVIVRPAQGDCVAVGANRSDENPILHGEIHARRPDKDRLAVESAGWAFSRHRYAPILFCWKLGQVTPLCRPGAHVLCTAELDSQTMKLEVRKNMTLNIDDLCSLEEYARKRENFRSRVMEVKTTRRVPVGAHVTIHLKNRLTMSYQIPEMLRAERIFEADGVQGELDAYNALIPDGSNWKATMMIEFEDVDERRDALARLRGIENAVWVRVGEHDMVRAIADEDLERQDGSKTSAVHFLRSIRAGSSDR